MSNKKSDKRISMTVKEKDIPAGIQPFSQFMIDNRGVDIPEYAFMIQPPNNYIICNAIQYARIKKTIGTQFSFTNFNDSCYLYILDDDKGDNCFFSPNLSNLDSITEYTDNNLVFTFLNNRGSFSTKKNNVKIVRYKRDKKTIFQRGADVETNFMSSRLDGWVEATILLYNPLIDKYSIIYPPTSNGNRIDNVDPENVRGIAPSTSASSSSASGGECKDIYANQVDLNNALAKGNLVPLDVNFVEPEIPHHFNEREYNLNPPSFLILYLNIIVGNPYIR